MTTPAKHKATVQLDAAGIIVNMFYAITHANSYHVSRNAMSKLALLFMLYCTAFDNI